MKKNLNLLKNKALWFVPFVLINLACKKTVFPPQEPEPDPTEQTTDTINPVLPVADTTQIIEAIDYLIEWNWELFRVGPHPDHILSYIEDLMCAHLRLMPDSLSHSSVYHSINEAPELWERVADSLTEYNQRYPGKLILDGAVIHVRKIVPDDVQEPTLTSGMWERTKRLFEQMGVVVKPEQPYGAKAIKAQNAFVSNTPQMAGANPKQKSGTFGSPANSRSGAAVKIITFGWHDFRHGISFDHLKRRADDPRFSKVIIRIDPSIYSVITACSCLLPEDWIDIARTFKQFKDYAPDKVEFERNIDYYGGFGEMPEEARVIFESLGLTIIEWDHMPGMKNAAMPWNQAVKMSKDR